MSSIPSRKSVARELFQKKFPDLKIQFYHDPASKGPGSHAIKSIAWSPTGALIATGSFDKTVRVWNPDKSRVSQSTDFRGHTGAVHAVGWNPVKEAELTSISSDGTCKFWDVRGKTCLATVPLGGEGWSLCWAPDGSVVMVGRKDDTLVEITTDPIPVVKDKYPQRIQTNQMHFNWSTPPTHLFLTRSDGSVSINSYPAMKTLHTLRAHTSSCLSVALSPNARHLAVGASDALLSIWDTTDWVCLRTVDSYVGMIKSVSFSFDGSYLVGSDDEGTTLDIIHVESGESVGKLPNYGSSTLLQGATAVAWHPNSYWIAWAGDGGVYIRPPEGAKDKERHEPQGLRISGAAGGSFWH